MSPLFVVIKHRKEKTKKSTKQLYNRSNTMNYVIILFELTDVVLEELNVNIKIKIRNEKNKTRNKVNFRR